MKLRLEGLQCGAVNRITLIGREVAQAQQNKIVDRLEENNIILLRIRRRMQRTKAPDKTPITNLVWNSWASQGIMTRKQ